MKKSVLAASILCLLCFQFLTAVAEIPRTLASAEADNFGPTRYTGNVLDPISGTVTDAISGDGIPGVNVLIKGTTSGTITDVNGNFNLDADQGNILVFSSVGYSTIEVEVGTTAVFNISLQEDVTALSEVVVVGYGTQEKRDVTAAIGSISAEQIKDIPVASSVESMQGQIAGVDVSSAGGRPGQTPQVRIRGRRSISASNDPLYVVDGIPMTSSGTLSNPIADINPQDIESMEVLKDAAGTSVYGSRGANGVILITTKRGRTGKTQVTYDGYYGVSDVTKTVDMMNGSQFAAMKRESRRADGAGNAAWDGTIPADDIVFDDPVELESIALGRSQDYQDLVLEKGFRTNHQLGVSGGSEKTQFNISLGFFKEQGIIKNMDYTRVTTRINVDHRISDRFKIGVSAAAAFSINNWGSSATMGEAVANNPLGLPFDAEGNLRFLPTNDGIRTNPLNELVKNAFVDERRVNRMFIPIYLEANIIEGLTYRLNFGPDLRFERRGQFRASLTNDNRGGPADAGVANTSEVGYTLENIVNYERSIGNNHQLGVTLLQSIQQLRFEGYGTEVSNLPYESQLFYNIGTAEVKGNLASTLQEWQLASFMGRVNYSINDKYLFQVSLRADGSSRLAPGNKWEYFPGISAGWRVIDEDFMSEVNFLSELKLRASYGEVGNTSVAPYQTAGRLRRTVYAWDESPAFGYGLEEIPNSDLKWEVSKTVDIGIDFGLFAGRLSGSFDWFSTNTEDLLLARNLPFTSGYQNILQNVGSTKTSGVELELHGNILDNTDGLTWAVDFNIAGYNEEITDLALKDANGNPLDDAGNNWFIGQPIRVFYDYQKIGIWQSNEVDQARDMENKVPGEIKLQDLDGDGVITPDDRTIVGTDIPDFAGGITNRLGYKGFDFSFFFYFKTGQTIDSRFHDSNNSLFARYNNLNVDYWTIDNPTNAYPRPNQNQERPRDDDTMRYFDGGFIKLRNVTLGYNFPVSVTDRLGMSNLRLYASAQNPWFSAKYDTWDPEIDEDDITSGNIPTSKVFLLGLSVKF
jgi:TonB-linked SusC/RagA family outer membrane protein